LDDGARLELAPSAESDFERRVAVREALGDVAALPRMQREVILMTAVDGRSNEETASALGVTHGAVRGLLYRARTTLRDAAAAIAPQPPLVWAGSWLGRLAPGGGRLAELSVPAGGADMGGVLVKGAALAASAAVLVAGAGITLQHRHGYQQPKVTVLAAGAVPATTGTPADALAAPGRANLSLDRSTEFGTPMGSRRSPRAGARPRSAHRLASVTAGSLLLTGDVRKHSLVGGTSGDAGEVGTDHGGSPSARAEGDGPRAASESNGLTTSHDPRSSDSSSTDSSHGAASAGFQTSHGPGAAAGDTGAQPAPEAEAGEPPAGSGREGDAPSAGKRLEPGRVPRD
jgi:DNA-binding CsgD family transcriptional regulator